MSRLRNLCLRFASAIHPGSAVQCASLSTVPLVTTTSTTPPTDAALPHRFLVTGAGGQLGTEMVPFLQTRVGIHNVVASDIRQPSSDKRIGSFVVADVQEKTTLERIIKEHGITYIVHFAALLSAIGEKQPQLALRVNTIGIQNVLELAAEHNVKVFAPSTIAVFGPTTPKHDTPDATVMQPTTMYGITKVHQELMGAYYHERYGVDFRSLRYPGIISAKAAPGGGTTDYAVEIFHSALHHGSYECFLSENTALPMMYMPDCIKATWDLMMAPENGLSQRTYNVTAMSFSPEQLADQLRRHLPHFKMECKPDFREGIAQTWPASIDDSVARKDWSWKPDFQLEEMCEDMLTEIRKLRRQQRSTYSRLTKTQIARTTDFA